MANATWFELIFVSVILPGMGCSIWRIVDAFRNFRAAEHDPDERLRRIGRLNIETAATILLVQGLFFLWGSLALVIPSPPRPPRISTYWLTVIYANRTLVFLAVLALTANAARAVIVRRSVQEPPQ